MRSLSKIKIFDITKKNFIKKNIGFSNENNNFKPIITFQKKKKIKTDYILSEFLGHKFEIYNGLKYIKLKINLNEMINKKLGEFVFTKQRPQHPKKKNKKK